MVVPLSEVMDASSKWDSTKVSSAQLITLSTPLGDQLAAVMHRPVADGSSMIERPMDDGQVLPYTDKWLLQTDAPEDRDLVAKFKRNADVSYALLSTGGSSSAVVAVAADGASPPQKSKLERQSTP